MNRRVGPLMALAGLILTTWAAVSARQMLADGLDRVPAPAALALLGVTALVTGTGLWLAERRRDAVPAIITWWWVVVGLVLMLVSAWALTEWMLAVAGRDPGRRLEAIRIGLTAGLGIGGALVFFLSLRQQWLRERTHLHDREIAAMTQLDATERRITDLYAKAAEQLGATTATVRLAGLYSLERLGRDHTEHRQTVLDLLCAYLQLPIDNPAEPHVCAAALAIIRRHLARDDPEFWTDMRLDLSSTTLTDADFTGCAAIKADFRGTKFIGNALFEQAHLPQARFDDAQFKDDLRAQAANFGGSTFKGTVFLGLASFENCTFSGAIFNKALFKGGARFEPDADVSLEGATVNGTATHRSWPNGWRTEQHPDSQTVLTRVAVGKMESAPRNDGPTAG